MNILVLDNDFNKKAIIDTYESLIWTDRYYGYGDFELYLPFSSFILNALTPDDNNSTSEVFIQIADSNATMIVESVNVKTDVETGNHLIVTGRSLESILERRVIWPQKTFKNTIYQSMRIMINDAIINPSAIEFKKPTYIKRKIDNFIFEDCEDETITNLILEPTEFTGDVLYDVILNWCQENEIGFDITLEDTYEYGGEILHNQFVMRLYRGLDRTYEQTENRFIVFSPSYDNIISTEYIEDSSPWRNYAIIAGEGDGPDRQVVIYGDLNSSGLGHRELYVDARDIQESELEEISYKEALELRGAEKLNECLKNIEFSGEVEARRQFVYGRDFGMGDIVEITNEYGIQGAARIIEYIHNDTDSGSDAYPTFEAIQDYGYEAEEDD